MMINKEKEAQINEALHTILTELSADQVSLKNAAARSPYFVRLEDIYASPEGEPTFRHLYSNIFSWLTLIDNDPAMSIDVLAENLRVLRTNYIPSRHNGVVAESKVIDIGDSLTKLYDHVNLDVSRINYVKTIGLYGEAKQRILEIETQSKQLDLQIASAEKAAASAEEKAENSQRESTAILGIFAAIVLTFTGGLAFSTSVLENIGNASIVRLLMAGLLIAFTLLNTIHMLLRFIGSIAHANTPNLHIGWINTVIGLMAAAVVICGICSLLG